MLIDTHCHIHDPSFEDKFKTTPEELYREAIDGEISHLVCVGTDLQSSVAAADFVLSRLQASASIALHPHEAEGSSREVLAEQMSGISKLLQVPHQQIVAVGECGLDYYYHEASNVKERQKWLLAEHLRIGLEHQLPFIFHVRDAFEDFFAILDEFKGVSGVIHSFSSGTPDLEAILSRGLYVGLNGIMTFTKDEKQLEAARNVPIERLLLETDAPFLTPRPLRGTICKPKHVLLTAEFLSELRGEPLEKIKAVTTENAIKLFGSRLNT
jgi:TatD DNase family protein